MVATFYGVEKIHGELKFHENVSLAKVYEPSPSCFVTSLKPKIVPSAIIIPLKF